MNVFQNCKDTNDAVEFFAPQSLYLKPTARLNITVQLPQMKLPGKTISNWEVIDKLKSMIKPDEFIGLKVSKSTLEFLRFEAEIENKSNLSSVITRLDTRTIKLSGFIELLKIRAAEAKLPFPTRHTWDSYFRDARNMNEMKPGERPDTIHISNIPCKWFTTKEDRTKGIDTPNEYLFKKVFEVFGEVRCVDIPVTDPYRNKMKTSLSGMKMFSFGQDLSFEGYVQFKEYISFVKAMDALRGMKLLYKEGDNAYTANIKVDFDKTKHLSEPCIRRRHSEREKLMALEREKEEKELKQQELEDQRKEEERLQSVEQKLLRAERQKQREEKRKHKQLMKLKEEETQKMNKKIAVEEKKLLIAQRKLESIRLLDELFERVKDNKQKEIKEIISVAKEQEIAKREGLQENKCTKKQDDENYKVQELGDKERELRHKLVKKYKNVHEQQFEVQKEKLLQTIKGKNKLRSVLGSSSKRYKQDVKADESNTLYSDDEKNKSSNSDNADMSTGEEEQVNWRGKQHFNWKKHHIVSHNKDRHWYHKNYYEDSQSYIYPFTEREDHPMHPEFFNIYHRNQFPRNVRSRFRGGYYPHKRGFYVPNWKRSYQSGHGIYCNFQVFPTKSSYYYDNNTKDYYRYFQKLAQGRKREKQPDTDSQCSESSSHAQSSCSKLSRTKSHLVSLSPSRSRSWSRGKSSESLSSTQSDSVSKSPLPISFTNVGDNSVQSNFMDKASHTKKQKISSHRKEKKKAKYVHSESNERVKHEKSGKS